MEIVELISDLFKRFVNERMIGRYHFADEELYSGAEDIDKENIEKDGVPQVFLNPFLKTEHDLAMKFGGFMEEELLNEEFIRENGRLTVHAEIIGLYNSNRERADMSIHRYDNGLWKTRNDIRNSTLAVIEIKGFGYRKPDVHCVVNRMTGDIYKLKERCTAPNAAQIMIIIDESIAGGRDFPPELRSELEVRYADIVKAALTNNVTLLSNNPKLNSRTSATAQSVL